MTLNKVLRTIVYGGVFLLPFVPLVVSQTMFFPFITAKNFAFRTVVEIIFVSWVILSAREPLFRPRRSSLAIAVLVFVGVIAVADIFGVSPAASFWSNFERMEGWITLAHLVAYFFVAGAVLSTDVLWRRFFHTSVGVSLIMSVYGLLQFAGLIVINQGGTRLDGRLGNATYLAIYMLFHIFITVFYLLRHRGKSSIRWVYAAVIALQFFVLYLTASRGVVLGLIVGLIIAALLVVLFERSPDRRKLRRVAGIGCLAMAIVIGGFFAIRNIPTVRNHAILGRFASISFSEGATRFRVWNMAWQGVQERPILGWGQGNFDVVFNKYFDPQMFSQEPWFDRAHNVVFDWLIAGGALGFLAYLALYGMALRLLWKDRVGAFSTTDKALFTGLLSGYFFQLLFVFDNITSYFLFFSVLAYVHATEGQTIEARRFAFLDRRDVFDRIVAPVLIVAALFVLYVGTVKPYFASRSLIQSLVRQPGGPSENLAYFRKTMSYNTFGSAEAREQLIQSALSVAAAQESAVSTDLKNQFLSYAADEIRKQTEEAPRSARYWFFGGSYLRRIGMLGEAIPMLEKAHELSPTKQQIAFELAFAYTVAKREQEGVAIMKQAFEAAPAYFEARVLYAVLAIRTGNHDVADELLVGEEGSAALVNDRVLGAYLDAGQMDKVVVIAEKRLAANPEDGQEYVSLAAAYLKAGNKEKSIETLERMIRSLPDTKAQGEKYIAEIRAGKKP